MQLHVDHRDLPSFPTRRSSDLSTNAATGLLSVWTISLNRSASKAWSISFTVSRDVVGADRKSTRLNSSHTVISYAVFCLKKKTISAAESTIHKPQTKMNRSEHY